MPKEITKEQAKSYFDAWREVYKDKRLRGADLPVLLFIRDTNWDIFYIAQKKFALSIGYSKKTVNESLKNLVGCGHLILTYSKPGSRKPNRYQLNKNLVSPVKNGIQRYTEGLLVDTPKGYSSKNEVVPDDTPKGYPNVINEKDLTRRGDIKKFSTSKTQDKDTLHEGHGVQTITLPAKRLLSLQAQTPILEIVRGGDE